MCVVGTALIWFLKLFREFTTLQTLSHSRQRFRFATCFVTRLLHPNTQWRNYQVTTVLHSLSPSSKLYVKTPNKNPSKFHNYVIKSVLNMIISPGCYMQVLNWKLVFIPTLFMVMGDSIQTPQTIHSSALPSHCSHWHLAPVRPSLSASCPVQDP